MKRFNLKALLFINYLLLASISKLYREGGEDETIKVEWCLKGITGKIKRASLQR